MNKKNIIIIVLILFSLVLLFFSFGGDKEDELPDIVHVNTGNTLIDDDFEDVPNDLKVIKGISGGSDKNTKTKVSASVEEIDDSFTFNVNSGTNNNSDLVVGNINPDENFDTIKIDNSDNASDFNYKISSGTLSLEIGGKNTKLQKVVITDELNEHYKKFEFYEKEDGSLVGLGSSIIIVLEDGASFDDIKSLVSFDSSDKLMDQIYSLEFKDKDLAIESLDILDNSEFIKSAELNLLKKIELNNVDYEDDEYINHAWHLFRKKGTETSNIFYDGLNVGNAWRLTNGKGIKVAVIDGGVNTNHEDLDCLVSYSAVSNKEGLSYDSFHGTSVAGIVGATDNTKGAVGIAPGVELICINIFPTSNEEEVLYGDGLTIIRAFNKALHEDVDIVTNSWGIAPGLSYTSAEQVAIKNVIDKGVHVFFATGNDGAKIRQADIMMSDSRIFKIGAVNLDGNKSSYSNYDGNDFMAFGGNDDQGGTLGSYGVFSPAFNPKNHAELGYIDKFNGTSAACPQVAGIAALVLSINPNLDHNGLYEILKKSSKRVGNGQGFESYDERGFSKYYGYGLLDACLAVYFAQNNNANENDVYNTCNVSLDACYASYYEEFQNGDESGAKAFCHSNIVSIELGGIPYDDEERDLTTCSDDTQNGDETGVDCGGSCPACNGGNDGGDTSSSTTTGGGDSTTSGGDSNSTSGNSTSGSSTNSSNSGGGDSTGAGSNSSNSTSGNGERGFGELRPITDPIEFCF